MKSLISIILNIIPMFIHFVSVIIWPLLISTTLWIFRKELKVLISRISTLQFPGVASITMDAQQTKDIQKGKVDIGEIKAVAEELKTTKDINKSLLALQNRTTTERDTYLFQFHFEKTYRRIFGSQLTLLLISENIPPTFSDIESIFNTTQWKTHIP